MWYTYDQNNSGGYYIENDMVGAILFIEALTQEEANAKMWEVVDGYTAWCSCCGPRWDTPWSDDDEGTETPELYGKKLVDVKSMKDLDDFMPWFGGSMVAHFLGGDRMVLEIIDGKLSIRTLNSEGKELFNQLLDEFPVLEFSSTK